MDSFELECALNTNIPHCCNEGFKLPCGHNVCFKCCNNDGPVFNQFSCKHCGKIVDKIKTKSCNKITKTKLNDLFKYTHQQYKDVLKIFEDCESTLETRVQYVLDEIDIRVESLKYELDNSRDSLKNEFESLKNELVRYFILGTVKPINLNGEWLLEFFDLRKLSERHNETQSDLEEFGSILSNKRAKTKENFIEYQTKVEDAHKLLENTNKEAIFEINEHMPLRKTIIATQLTTKTIKKYLETKTYESFELDENLVNIFELQNRQTVFAYEAKIKIMNNTTGQFNENPIEVMHLRNVAVNADKTRLYLTYEFKIAMTDTDFKELKTFTKLAGNKKIEPRDATLFKNFLYVTDKANKGIIKFTANLDHQSFTKFEDNPYSIRIASNGIACVLFHYRKIGFYNVNSNFHLIYTYNKFVDDMNVSIVNDEFYIFKGDSNTKTQSMACYNNIGVLKEEFTVVKPCEYVEFKEIFNCNGRLYTSFRHVPQLHRTDVYDYSGFPFFVNFNNRFHDSDSE